MGILNLMCILVRLFSYLLADSKLFGLKQIVKIGGLLEQKFIKDRTNIKKIITRIQNIKNTRSTCHYKL